MIKTDLLGYFLLILCSLVLLLLLPFGFWQRSYWFEWKLLWTDCGVEDVK